MSIKEIWLAAWRLYKKSIAQVWYFGVMAGIVVTVFFSNNMVNENSMIFKLVKALINMTMPLIFVYLASIILIRIASNASEKNISLSQVLAIVKQRYLKMAIAMLIIYIMGYLGNLIVVLPGIFIVIFSIMVEPLILLEDKRIIESIIESCKLVWERLWITFAALFPLILVYIGKFFLVPVSMRYNDRYLIVVSVIVLLLFYPVWYSLVVVVFYDLKVKRPKEQTLTLDNVAEIIK